MEIFALALLSSFILTLICGKILIPILHRLKFGQQVRTDGPQEHLKKQGTPTMGGLIFILPIALLSFVFTEGNIAFTLVCVLMTVGFGAIGFIDDYIKVVKKRSLGLKAYQKIVLQFLLSLIFALYAYFTLGSRIHIPFSINEIDLGGWYVPFIVFAVVAMVNSTNLTDGIDGLLSNVSLVCMCSISAILFLLIFVLEQYGSTTELEQYINLFRFGGIVMGGCMGFLIYNANPAKVFMGDCGSMALGGAITAVCVLMRMPLTLVIVGFIFIIEAVSDILQVASFKLRHKRLFRMAPIHHHFELGGMKENQVVTMFTIVQGILALVAMISVLPLLA